MASHKKDTEANISTFAHYANELSDAALTRAVYRNQNDQGARFEDLWNLPGTLVSTDNPGRSRPPDGRNSVRSRYRVNRERWEVLRR